MTELQLNNLLMTVGLCAKAGKLVFGTEQICDALHSGKKVYAVLEASDTSANTHKKLTDKCNYYGVKIFRLEADTAVLAHAVGKSSATAAVAVTDQGLAKAIETKIQ